jgi:hypothetical protein
LKRRAGYDILRRLCAAIERWPGSPSDLLTAVLELQLELPPFERGDHAAELFPGELATVDEHARGALSRFKIAASKAPKFTPGSAFKAAVDPKAARRKADKAAAGKAAAPAKKPAAQKPAAMPAVAKKAGEA